MKPTLKYAITFRDLLKDLATITELGNIYKHLFSLMTDADLELLLIDFHDISQGEDSCYGEIGKTEWFAIFHKSLRQTDFFNNCYQKSNKKILVPDERKRMLELKKIFYDKSVSETEREELKKSHKEELNEYFSYVRKLEEENKTESIGGQLNMILSNAIYLDKANHLIRIFENVFEEAKEGFLFIK